MQVLQPPDEAEAGAAPRAAAESLAADVRRLALAKAQAVADAGATGRLLACDTLSEVDGEVLGKPADAEDARRMLRSLSGRGHRVVTGVCLWQMPELEPILADCESLLEMGELSEGFLDWYIESGMWRGKAGACGFQDDRLPLRLVSGSASNVVGLPLETIRPLLADLDRRLTPHPLTG